MTRFAGLEPYSLKSLAKALERLEAGFEALPEHPYDASPESLETLLLKVADLMGDNYPYFHPLYAGQMLKPPHPVARAAYALCQYINPNNHALDGGRASTALELEAVERLATMFGWDTHLGHLTGGGTIANLEALWVARELKPGAVVASAQAHYTHSRLAGVLGMDSVAIPTDASGRMDMDHLRTVLESREVSVVVATAGTTSLGSVDPVADLADLREEIPFRLHVDAAYGGYFVLAENLPAETKRHFAAVSRTDSIVIDPHKHGLQPYGCGCVLFADPAVGRVYKHDSSVTYFTSGDLHLGEISLECSRAGAAAVALWATQEVLPYTAGGQFAESLERCRRAALALHAWLDEHDGFTTLMEPELDIVVYGVPAPTARRASELAQRVFDAAAERGLHLALASFPKALAQDRFPGMDWDQDTLTCLRSCLLKPDHEAWIPAIAGILEEARSAAG